MRYATLIGLWSLGTIMAGCAQQAPAQVEYRGETFYGDKQLAALYERINQEYAEDETVYEGGYVSHSEPVGKSKFSSGNESKQAYHHEQVEEQHSAAPIAAPKKESAVTVRSLEPVRINRTRSAPVKTTRYERPSLASEAATAQASSAQRSSQNNAIRQASYTPAATADTKLYVVKPGETLFRISKNHGVTVQELIRLNHIQNVTEIKAGHAIRIPADASSVQTAVLQQEASKPESAAKAEAVQEGTSEVKTLKAEAAMPSPRKPAAPVETASMNAPEPKPSQPKASAKQSGFIWPVRGNVIAQFGRQSGGLYNDGINIEAPEGSPVKAASGGTVVYAGNELQGYGNLAILRHEGGWLTAYAHNRELLVSRGERVNQGQVIAKVGRTGKVNKAQLHFGVRRGKEAKNPLEILSADKKISRSQHASHKIAWVRMDSIAN